MYVNILARKIAWAPRKKVVGVGADLLPTQLPPSEGLRLFFEPNLFPYNTPHSQPQSHFIPYRLWRWNRQSVPKCWHLNNRCRGITQKKAHDIQNTAKVWNQELLKFSSRSTAKVKETESLAHDSDMISRADSFFLFVSALLCTIF
jgi:hypothetical protein